jgi:putative DNA primase/helicase
MAPKVAALAPNLLEHYGIVAASTIVEEDVTWLWGGYFPDGALVLVEGNPDTGKTMLVLSVVAAVSAGRPLPFGPAVKTNARNVLYLTAEDSLSKTIVKRLKAAEANLAQVFVQVQQGADLLLPGCIEHLRRMIHMLHIRVVVLDALNNYLDASAVDINKDQEVRQALRPLRDLAEQEGVTIIGLRHLNKATDKPSMYRGAGSIALTAVARSTLLVARHPEDHDLRVMLSQKCNLIEEAKRPPRGFRIARDAAGRPRLEWLPDDVGIDAEELLGPRKPGPTPDMLERAKAYLADHLKDGPKRRQLLLELAERVHFNERLMERAAKALGVKSTSVGREREWSL